MSSGSTFKQWGDRLAILAIVGALAVVAIVSWAIVLWQAGASSALMSAGVPMAFGSSGRLDLGSALLFLAIWLVMMAAMMLPSVWPAVLTYAAGSSRRGSSAAAAFVVGYLIVWEGFGVAAYVVYVGMEMVLTAVPTLMDRLPLISGLLVILAGLYQFTRLKTRCLDQCQQPATAFGAKPRDGAAGGLRFGLQHGVTCIGCCSGHMLALVALGAMDLRWMVAATILIALEKLGPRTHLLPLLLGVGLVIVGALVALAVIPLGGGGMSGMAM